MIYILLSILIILFIILIINIKKKRKFEEETKEQYIQSKLKEYEQSFKFEENKLKELREKSLLVQQNTQEKETQANKIIEQLNKRKEEVKSSTNEIINNQTQIIDEKLKNHYESAKREYTVDLLYSQNRLLEDALDEFNSVVQPYYQIIADLEAQINDYQLKQSVINEEILRRRAIEEQKDFYRVNLSTDAIEDIRLINTIRPKLHSHDGLDKLIYDIYVNKQVMEMTKRILKGEAPSGIYKITRLKTGEIYIGKSTDVKSRWQQHCKTVFGVGTIAHSILHTTMEKDGLENFTFELLEEVPKDKLGEREKYWINFYDSKKYGLNEKEGG